MELNLDDDRLLDIPVSDATITARILPLDELVELGKKHTHIVMKGGVRTERLDSNEYSKEFWDRTIVSWQGISRGGVPIPCNADTKFKTIMKFPEIADEINAGIADAKAATIEADKAAQKD